MAVRAKIRDWCDGLGPFLGGAGVLIVFAFLVFLLLSLSPQDRLQWTGAHVTGKEQNGVVAYFWHGERYTIPVPGFGNKPRETLRVDRSDPTHAALDAPGVRITDAATTLGPVALAACVIGIGVRRKRRQSRQRQAVGSQPAPSSFGTGLDPDFVRRQLEERRRPPR